MAANILTLLALFFLGTIARPQTSPLHACNNSPSLCDKSYGEVTYLGAHDAAFVSNSSNGYTIAGNQNYNATVQLSAGVRLLQSQMHYQNGTDKQTPIHLCHTDCLLYDAGPVQNFLTEVRTWMDANPDEVVTLLLVNDIHVDAATLGPIFSETGLASYAYTPPSPQAASWPTLRQMISSNKRLVVFIASLPTGSTNEAAPYLLNEFDHIWENAYSNNSPSDFSCQPDRPAGLKANLQLAQASARLPLINHFLYQKQLFGIQTPDRDAAADTNSPSTTVNGALGTALQNCTAQMAGRKPTFVLVDWFNVGPAIQAVDAANGIADPIGRAPVSSSLANRKRISSDAPSARGGRGSSAAALAIGFAIAVRFGFL